MNHSKHNEHERAMEAGHESSTIQVGAITWFIIVLTVSVVFVGWLMAALLNTFEGREKRAELESRPSPFAAERSKLPPEPRLQLAPNSEEQIERNQPPNLKTQHPLEEIKQLQSEWDKQLTSYGWVDQPGGIVRIPVEDAKRLLLQRGLPARAAKKPDAATPAEERKQ